MVMAHKFVNILKATDLYVHFKKVDFMVCELYLDERKWSSRWADRWESSSRRARKGLNVDSSPDEATGPGLCHKEQREWDTHSPAQGA